ncbi:MAG: flagellar type III secretion system pore protein FliP [Pseudomonadota bacterium]|jgi:flagellar biosynthesis protein FliP|uniref:Flagellar biosynthetic protein FliP n=2 Tax=Methylophaga TaxID=40222 RepID=F5T1Y0_9GAMM|nr:MULTISPECIES: flagellar type III secretion system pore protein FliP [Methylophaga]MEC9412917.1 flagellar type III secretion system pore protein FliP [Pseudomonadota bacterium]EGL53390.1 flagellar biosynthesis pathway, component FliP [Methylophaga aminisulfidivorans MP]WVI84800.1 flagellar type III secretion system pore protein FliP [Methylophaga thalassica]GLP99876.1 flagellar biosynthetic protein FliP [Methylophaga thalassica]HIC46642.1 flagellar type III secretion system pore protein FliP
MIRLLLSLCLLAFPLISLADPGIPAVTVTDGEGGQSYSVTLQILALMTALTLLPAALMMMTSFTRIIIVLAILRQAIGVQSTPSNQVLIGLALFLTIFIMHPVFNHAYNDGIVPYMNGDIEFTQAIEQTGQPFKEFMLAQTRESDIALFASIGGYEEMQTPQDIPYSLLLPSFVTSELKTAFQIGFLIFIPFLIIDLVVASVLMAMGMMMLSPMLISLPFKLMLFVLIDGWALLMGTLASSFYV